MKINVNPEHYKLTICYRAELADHINVELVKIVKYTPVVTQQLWFKPKETVVASRLNPVDNYFLNTLFGDGKPNSAAVVIKTYFTDLLCKSASMLNSFDALMMDLLIVPGARPCISVIDIGYFTGTDTCLDIENKVTKKCLAKMFTGVDGTLNDHDFKNRLELALNLPIEAKPNYLAHSLLLK